jgi:sortase B
MIKMEYKQFDDDFRKRRRKLKVLYAILALSTIAMVVLAVMLFREMREIRQGQDFFAELAVEIPIMPITPPPTPTPPPAPNPTPEPIEEPEPEPEPFEPMVDFEYMREQMPNIIAWIVSEGTVINYPVVQGTDNDFYLYHLPDGTRNQLGSIFIDYRNLADFSDNATFIFGHNMQSRDKFGTLLYYADQEHFDQHPEMYLFTPTHNFRIELFSGFEVDSALEIPPMYFTSAGHFYSFIEEAIRRSTFESSVQPSFGDRIVYLVTCADFGPITQRVIIVGRLVEML